MCSVVFSGTMKLEELSEAIMYVVVMHIRIGGMATDYESHALTGSLFQAEIGYLVAVYFQLIYRGSLYAVISGVRYMVIIYPDVFSI